MPPGHPCDRTGCCSCLHFFVLGPIYGLLGAIFGSLVYTVAFFGITLCFAPQAFCLAAQMTCATRKLGLLAKAFMLLFLVLPTILALPVGAVAGALAGCCCGATSGFVFCGIAYESCEAISDACRQAVNSFFQPIASYKEYLLISTIESMRQQLALERAFTPPEDFIPVELNPLKAATSLVAGVIWSCFGVVFFALCGLRFYVPIVCSTWSRLGGLCKDHGIGICPCATLVYILTPFIYLLCIVLYPIAGFFMCFVVAVYANYMGSYTRSRAPNCKVLVFEEPVVEEKERSWWWPFGAAKPTPKSTDRAAQDSWWPSFLTWSTAEAPKAPVPARDRMWLPSIIRPWSETFQELGEPLLVSGVDEECRASNCLCKIGDFVGITGFPTASMETIRTCTSSWEGTATAAREGPSAVVSLVEGFFNCLISFFACLECIFTCNGCCK